MKTIKEIAAERAGREYADMRKQQFEADNLEMVRALNPEAFKTFCLRWNTPPPPTGFGDVETIMRAMHMRRVVMPALEMEERMKSVRYLLSVNLKLPPQVLLVGDVMTGHLVDLGM